MLSYLTLAFAFAVLIIGSITDIKKREVPDWINYSLIACGFSFNLLYSLIRWDFSHIINSIAGFVLFLIIALAMFYTGQWGGGDSKLLMGLGALFGVNIAFFKMIYLNFMNLFNQNYPMLVMELPFSINFLSNVILIGAFYGLIWCFILVLAKRKKFLRGMKNVFKNDGLKKTQKSILAAFFVLMCSSLLIKDFILKMTIISLLIVLVVVFYLWIFIKIVENSCMLKYLKPKELTEGDWIAKDIKVNGKYVCGPKDLGIEKKQINKLIRLYKKNKIKRVLIKEGIPFVPSFLIAFVISIIWGNIFRFFV